MKITSILQGKSKLYVNSLLKVEFRTPKFYFQGLTPYALTPYASRIEKLVDKVRGV